MQGVPCTQSSTANTTVDTDRQVQPPTALEECQTMQPVLLRDSNTFRGIKAEPVTLTDNDTSDKQSFTDSDLLEWVKREFVGDTDILKGMNSDPYTDVVTSKNTHSKSLPDTGSFKCEPVTDLDTLTVIETEPITDTDTRTNNRAGPATDTSTATTIQPVDDPAVSKTDTAVSMEPLPPREGQERLPSEPQPADKEVSHNA